MAKAVTKVSDVGLARLLLNQAGARVRACTGAVRLVLNWTGAGLVWCWCLLGADRFTSPAS